MKNFSSLLFALFFPLAAHAHVLNNNTLIEITQSWPQQPAGWTYPISVSVPDGEAPIGGFPVCILLHGNGGSGAPMLNQFRSILPDHALVAPTGYLNSWNICAEGSDAPDWSNYSNAAAQASSKPPSQTLLRDFSRLCDIV